MPEIYYEIPIQAPAEKCFEAITSESKISEWWLPNSKFIALEGSIGTFPFPDGRGQIRMKVEEINPQRKLVWRCLEHKHQDWINTIVTFEIVSEADGTCLLRFTHSGWKDKSETFGRVSYFWAAAYLSKLRSMLA